MLHWHELAAIIPRGLLLQLPQLLPGYLLLLGRQRLASSHIAAAALPAASCPGPQPQTPQLPTAPRVQDRQRRCDLRGQGSRLQNGSATGMQGNAGAALHGKVGNPPGLQQGKRQSAEAGGKTSARGKTTSLHATVSSQPQSTVIAQSCSGNPTTYICY